MAEATLVKIQRGEEEGLVYQPLSCHLAIQLLLVIDIAPLFSKSLLIPLLTVTPRQSHIPLCEKHSSTS